VTLGDVRHAAGRAGGLVVLRRSEPVMSLMGVSARATPMRDCHERRWIQTTRPRSGASARAAEWLFPGHSVERPVRGSRAAACGVTALRRRQPITPRGDRVDLPG
jgi:hypothetical protein